MTPTRLLDTRHHIGVPTTAPVGAGKSVSFGVPAGASSVVLNVTVTAPTASGYITAYATGTTPPMTSNLNFVKGQTVPNLVVAPVKSGKVSLLNGSKGSVHLLADISGYFAGGAPGQGGFAAAGPTRLLDTRYGVGAAKAVVGAHKYVSFAVTDGNPPNPSAVVLNVTATGSTASGYITAYPGGPTPPSASNLNFGKGQTVPNLVVVPVGSDGQVTLYNGSTGTVQLIADVQGYFAAGDPTTAGAFGALTPVRVLDTRYGIGASQAPVGAGKVLPLTVGGRGGVPLSAVSAVVLNVTVTGPTASGYITAYSGSTPPTVSNLNYATGQTVANLVVVKPDSTGRVTFYNGSKGSVHLIADVAGYVLNQNLSVPAKSTSRYVSSIAAISDSGQSGEGCTDARSNFVLLDIGAQTVTPPRSTSDPGVALVNTNPVVRVRYADLRIALNGYLAGFAACQPAGNTARIAVGTNNSGAFTGPNAYPAAQRGADWANQVIDLLDPHPGIQIVGADDIESYFSSSEADAEAWENAYLDNTSANLINNGSADNCPDSYGSNAECGAVLDENGTAKTWTRANYVSLSYGLRPGRISVLPQIYFGSDPDQAVEWLNVDATSGNRLTFVGSLTQYGICGAACGFTYSEGWASLYHALSTITSAPQLVVATDLQPH